MNIGSEVRTIHGDGVITKKDLPESTVWRWVVKITKPVESSRELVFRFRDAELAFFPHEVSALTAGTDERKP